jgi:YHS domain-containing protein
VASASAEVYSYGVLTPVGSRVSGKGECEMSVSRWWVSVIAACGVVGVVSTAWAEEPVAAASTNAVQQQTMCPVMKQPINKKLYVDCEGKRVYVCCRSCVQTVKQDPAKYVKMLEDQGITLDKAETPPAPPVPGQPEKKGTR